MGIILNQAKTPLTIFNEKTEHVFLGEILHFVLENLLISGKNNLRIFDSEEKFLSEALKFLKKALACRAEPLSLKNKIKEKALDILKNLYKNQRFVNFARDLLKDAEVIYKEVESFLKEKDDFNFLRPDLIVKTKNAFVLVEFKLHQPGLQEKETIDQQIKQYLKLLQQIKKDANIKAVLVCLEPFFLEEKEYNVRSAGHPTQLSLFENLM